MALSRAKGAENPFFKELSLVGLCALEGIAKECGLEVTFHKLIISYFGLLRKLCGVAASVKQK